MDSPTDVTTDTPAAPEPAPFVKALAPPAPPPPPAKEVSIRLIGDPEELAPNHHTHQHIPGSQGLFVHAMKQPSPVDNRPKSSRSYDGPSRTHTVTCEACGKVDEYVGDWPASARATQAMARHQATH